MVCSIMRPEYCAGLTQSCLRSWVGSSRPCHRVWCNCSPPTFELQSFYVFLFCVSSIFLFFVIISTLGNAVYPRHYARNVVSIGNKGHKSLSAFACWAGTIILEVAKWCTADIFWWRISRWCLILLLMVLEEGIARIYWQPLSFCVDECWGQQGFQDN